CIRNQLKKAQAWHASFLILIALIEDSRHVNYQVESHTCIELITEQTMSRNLLANTLIALAFLSGFSACIEQEFDSYSLHVKARGLSDTESIIVSNNGSNLEIIGTSDLSWTELREFRHK